MEILFEDFSYGLFLWQFIMVMIPVCSLIALIDVLRHRFENNDKLIWTFVSLIPFIGPILYVVIGRKQCKRLI